MKWKVQCRTRHVCSVSDCNPICILPPRTPTTAVAILRTFQTWLGNSCVNSTRRTTTPATRILSLMVTCRWSPFWSLFTTRHWPSSLASRLTPMFKTRFALHSPRKCTRPAHPILVRNLARYSSFVYWRVYISGTWSREAKQSGSRIPDKQDNRKFTSFYRSNAMSNFFFRMRTRAL